MRFEFKSILLVVLLGGFAAAQGTPPRDPAQESRLDATVAGTPPEAPTPPGSPERAGVARAGVETRLAQMKNLIKTQVRRALDGKPYPALQDWQPLTGREKFDYFLHSTYAPRTFVNAGVDVISNRIKGRDRNPEYETGLMGLGQHYGIELATAETDVFFKRFLFPALLRQDPRYFRNPDLPFFKRALYSMTRVVITRTDSGGATFNSSSFLGAFSARALGDLYVPGQRQGMHPLTGCISYNLLRDAGMNLVHEFWPDFRRKFLHR